MQTIDLINGKGYKVIEFPDGELHLDLEELNRKESVGIICRIINGNDLFLLMQLSDILKRQCVEVEVIQICYLMGMRCDRLFDINRPFTLGIISDVINSFGAKSVLIHEPHSQRVLNTIKNCAPIMCTMGLSQKLSQTNEYVLVAPDKGAKDRYSVLNIPVICSKIRDVATGKLLEFSVEATTDVSGKDLLVIDDLCDGGGTFVGLAPKLRELKPKSLSLLVTHAVQKQGIERVLTVYDKVFITDSYKDWAECLSDEKLEVLKVAHI